MKITKKFKGVLGLALSAMLTLGTVNVNDETNICFKPIFPKVETGTVIVWKKHQIFSSATTKFIEEIKSAFKEK